MNNKEFITELSARSGYSSKETSSLINSLVDTITGQLSDENVISISGFGLFEVKKKLEKVMVNPSTKQKMLIPPKMVVSFKPNTSLKDKANTK